jgi:hypothetical protein
MSGRAWTPQLTLATCRECEWSAREIGGHMDAHERVLIASRAHARTAGHVVRLERRQTLLVPAPQDREPAT